MQDAPPVPDPALPGWLGAVLAVAGVGAAVVTAFMPAIVEKIRGRQPDAWANVVDEALDDARTARERADRLWVENERLRQENAELRAQLRQLGGDVR